MRDVLPKIIGGVVVVAVIGGAMTMVARHKNAGPVSAPVPVAAPPLPATPVVQETRKYKRDMLDYVPETAAAANKAPPAQAPAPAPHAADTGRAKLQLDKIAHELKMASPQLKEGDKISLLYTCNQKNISPPLSWSHAPSGTKSYVVMMEGPNKGQGEPMQWGVYNIPASETSLPEAFPKLAMNDKGIGQAQTEGGATGYDGPCIPKGEYYFVFSVYALDTDLKLKGGATRNELINAMNGHIIDMARLPVTHYFRL